MKIGEVVQIDLEENKRGITEVPEYLNWLPYKIKWEIMFSVIWLLDETLPIHISDIEDSIKQINEQDEFMILWSRYFRDSVQQSNISIH